MLGSASWVLGVEEEEGSCLVAAALAARAALSEQGGLTGEVSAQDSGLALHTHPSTVAFWGGCAPG